MVQAAQQAENSWAPSVFQAAERLQTAACASAVFRATHQLGTSFEHGLQHGNALLLRRARELLRPWLEGGQQQQPALGRTAAAMAAATGAQVHAGCDGALLFCFSGARTQSGGVGLAAALEPTPTASQLAQQQLLGRLPAEAAASLLRTVGPPAGAGALPAAAPAPAKVAPTAVAPAAAMAPVEAKHRLPVQQEVVMVVREASQLAQRTAGLASGFERLLTLAEEGSARRAPQQGAAAPEVTAAVREASQLARRVVQHSAQLELLLQPALPRRVLRPGGHLPAVPARPANARPSRREPAAAAAGQDKSATHSRGAMLPAAQSAAVQPSVPAGASAAPDVTCATLRPSLPAAAAWLIGERVYAAACSLGAAFLPPALQAPAALAVSLAMLAAATLPLW